jgi:peptide deformylase
MARLTIHLYGDPILRRKAEPVPVVDDEIRQLAADMVETMYDANGVGLAAPQVGRSIRMLVADASHHDGAGGPRAFINPEIVDSWDEWIYDEGCLSVPGLTAELVRPEAVLVRFHDEQGQLHEEEFHQLWARVLQHEIDHLDGKLFVDRMSPMRRALVEKKLRELSRESKTRISP